MSRPSLLFLGQTLPFPPDSGVAIRSYHVLRTLGESFDVTALCFYRWRSVSTHRQVAESESALRALPGIRHFESFPIAQEHSRARLAWDHVSSLLARRVYTWFVYKSRRFELALRNALAARPFEIVHLDSLDLARYLPLLRALPVACTHHNVESMLLQRRASGEPRRVRRAYMSRQAALMQQQERRWCPRVALNVAVSRADLEALRRIAGGGEYLEVPNGVDTHYFRPETGREGGVVFVGGTTWYPNRDALDYFCEDILPHLRRALPSVRIRWVGRSSAAEQETFGRRYGVELSGYVADIRPFVSDAGCFVVPLRIGGGTRLKILNAWAMGKAVVSTSVGCEGLHAVDGENILIRDTAAAFADAVSTVLLDPALRTRLGTAGRATAEREYAWEVIGAPMLERYMALARGHRLVAPRPQPTP